MACLKGFYEKLYVYSVFVLSSLFQMNLLASDSDSDSDSDFSLILNQRFSEDFIERFVGCEEFEKKIIPVINGFVQSIDQFGVQDCTTRIIQAKKQMKYNKRFLKYDRDLFDDPTYRYREMKTENECLEIKKLTYTAAEANLHLKTYVSALEKYRGCLLTNSSNQDQLADLRTETIDLFNGVCLMGYNFSKTLNKQKTPELRKKLWVLKSSFVKFKEGFDT